MIHNNEKVPPEYPLATLVSGTWAPGKTVRPLRPLTPLITTPALI
jgi:hypothetical protein